jgi:hypothetical protein
MSTAANPPPPAPAPKAGRMSAFFKYLFTAQGQPGELVIISHSNLFYWWPVWLLGFIMAGVTYFGDTHMAIVPAHTEAAHGREVQVVADNQLKTEKRDVLILPPGARLPPPRDAADPETEVAQPTMYMAQSKQLGNLYVFVVLLVIIITNIPLRGLWSVLTVVVLVVWVIIFAQLGLWDRIFRHGRLLQIHINMGGYLFMSITLCIIWLVSFFFFDRQFYVIITPGQVRVHLEIGGGETAYDTTGMVFQKQRSDLFRHWVLGFGSGDLIIRPTNSREHINLPNVTLVARRVRAIEARLKEKQIVAA